MSRITDDDAFHHASYRDGTRRAAQRAFNEGGSFSLYYDGEAIYVRASEAAPPSNSKLICIAQKWDDASVQLRFDGGRSEFISNPGGNQ